MIQKIKQLSLQYANEQIVPLSILYENKYLLYIDIPTQKLYKGANILINQTDYQKQYNIIKWRLQMENQFPILKLNGFQIKNQSLDGLSVVLFIQHSSQTLQNFQNLTIQQTLYILKTILVAMEKLLDKFGFFKITSKMIIITKSHTVKLWVSQNFQQNSKTYPRFYQEQMIKQLFDIVQKCSTKSELSIEMFKIAQSKCHTFIRAQNFLQQFAFQHKIIVPPLLFPQKMHKKRQSLNATNLNIGLTFQNDFRKRDSSYRFYKNLANQSGEKKEFFDFKKSLQMKQKSRKWKNKNSNEQNSKRILMSQKLMSKSKQITMAESTQIINNKQNQKSLIQLSNSYFNKYNVTTSILKFQQTSRSQEQSLQDQNKRFAIMSALNMKISVDSYSKENNIEKTIKYLQDFQTKQNKINGRKLSISPSRHKSLNPSDKQELDCIKNIQTKYKSSKWIRKISQLFSSQKDLTQSIKDGQDEIAFLQDIKLDQLQKFGRFVCSNIFELQEKEENQKYLPNIIQQQQSYDNNDNIWDVKQDNLE